MGDALQTRFRTEWDTESNPAYDVWTSVNGSEVVPGVLSPLTATTFNRYDCEGLRTLMAQYPGGHRAELFDPPVGNFFGVFGGRLALNNGFAVAATSALDADIAQAILQQFFTGAEGGERYLIAATADERAAAYEVATRHRDDAPRVLDGYRERLMAERASGRYEQDLALPLDAAWERFVELAAENGIELINTHYIVSVAAGEWQVRVAGTIQAGGGDPNLVVPLCSGLGEVESSKPAAHLFRLGRVALDHDEVAQTLDDDLDVALTALADPPTPGWQAFADAFAEFLSLYGHRVQGEADPTNADWSEQPMFAISQVRSMMAVSDDESPDAHNARAVAVRETLEEQVRAGLPCELQAAFDDCLAKAQHFTRLREYSKAMWVLGARRARAPYLAIARSLHAADIVDDPDDMRFLFHAELGELADGSSVADIRERIVRRRAQAGEAEQWSLPDNWVGEPEMIHRGEVADTRELNGLGVSMGSGPVTGTARIIPSTEAGLARDIDVGDILVAPFTDTPWTPLFIPAGAVVVETGGVLSHAATVAREFGIPAVVMCKDATRIIHEGDTVAVDGAAGTVTIVERV